MEQKSTASTRAKNKYNAKMYDQIKFNAIKGTKDKYRAYADKAGLPLSEFIRDAIEEKAVRENL